MEDLKTLIKNYTNSKITWEQLIRQAQELHWSEKIYDTDEKDYYYTSVNNPDTIESAVITGDLTPEERNQFWKDLGYKPE